MLRFFCAALCATLFALPPCLQTTDAADPAGDAAPDRAAERSPIYELRIYTCEPGKLAALEERFQNHTLRIFEKHGMKNLGYWVPSDPPTSKNTLIYFLEHASRDAAQKSWTDFRADPEWKQVVADCEAKYGKILAKPPESTFLHCTDYSPSVGLPHADRCFDLRIYTASPGKLDELNARFRNHTDQLFRKHGMQAYGYWMPVDAPRSANTLIYVLEFPNREAASTSWAAFRADPAWKKVREESEQNGSLTASRPASLFMELTPFSPIASTTDGASGK